MASFKNNPIIHLHLLLLIVSPPFHQAHKLTASVSNTNTLIESECSNSKTPETCMKCLKSDPGSESADRVGIAMIIVNCISSQAEALMDNMSGMAMNNTFMEWKTICFTCSSQYNSANYLLSLAKQALQNHEYDKAEYFVNGSLGFDSACHDNCKEFQDKVPGDVFDRMKNYEKLSEDASAIIKRLNGMIDYDVW